MFDSRSTENKDCRNMVHLAAGFIEEWEMS